MKLVAQDLAPEGVDLAALGEEAVAADVEAIPLVLVGPADAADQPGIGLEDDARSAVLRQLVGGGQPAGTAAGDHRLDTPRRPTSARDRRRASSDGESDRREPSAIGAIPCPFRLLVLRNDDFRPHVESAATRS